MTAQLHDVESRVAKMQDFISKIPQELLSDAAMVCKGYERSLMHMENHIREFRCSNDSVMEEMNLIERWQMIYGHIDEPDGLMGAATVLRQAGCPAKSIERQILELSSSGNVVEVKTCYEVAAQTDRNTISHHFGLSRCLLSLGHLGSSFLL
jgi:hypothetical protein